ncbi:MAG: YbaN family protein [Candidatus Saganbacteria bacterium]|nr:YbaN family protein [Candidatus Saganbacteria bacterium]
MKGLIKILLIGAGTFFVVLGFVGIFLPLLPTTPFLLLAAACYARSCEKFYNWLLSNRWFGQYIKDWRAGRGIPLKTKVFAISLLILTIAYSALFVVPNIWAKVGLGVIAIGVSLHIISQPTLKKGGDVSWQ